MIAGELSSPLGREIFVNLYRWSSGSSRWIFDGQDSFCFFISLALLGRVVCGREIRPARYDTLVSHGEDPMHVWKYGVWLKYF